MMPRVPSRKILEDMKRADLQKLCKDYGVRANLKTDALIEMLLDTSKPLPPKAAPTQRSRTSSAATRVSSRRTSGRSRGPSKSSLIIHDSADEEEDEEAQNDDRTEETAVAPSVNANGAENEDPAPPSEAEPTPPRTPPPVTRTRKAKESQTRLGKGRPVIAGGTGARAITKSVSVSRGSKRGVKSSKSIQNVQDTIPEEEPEVSPIAPAPLTIQAEPEASGSNHVVSPVSDPQPGSLAFLEGIDKRVADALRPLHAQMSSLKSEVERLKTQVSEIPALQLKVKDLTAEVEVLRTSQAAKATALEMEMGRLKDDWTRKNPVQGSSTGPGTPGKVLPGKYGSLAKAPGWNGPSPIAAARTSVNGNIAHTTVPPTVHAAPTATAEPPHPGFAATVIGKRRRDSDASNVTGVVEEGHEDEFSETELEKRVIRPTKKRAKLDLGGGSQEHNGQTSEPLYTQQEGGQAPAPRAANFTVFSGPDDPDNLTSYIDPPPPTNHLPDFFAPSPDHPNFGNNINNGTQTSTAHASENQNPFGFNFLPMTSTPMHPIYPLAMPSFPFPEAPTSPSPAGTDRTFQPFGLPPSRPRSGANNSRPGSRQGGDGTVNPAALTGSHQESSSNNNVTPVFRLTTAPMRMGEGSIAGLAKRTMYGTELEDDTRFGDFGRERVGFWADGKF